MGLIEEAAFRILVKSILMIIACLIAGAVISKLVARKAKKTKEMREIDGEPVILASPASLGWWAGVLILTSSRLIHERAFPKKQTTIPLNAITKYEAKYDSLNIYTQLKKYKFGVADVNPWIDKLNELKPPAKHVPTLSKEITPRPVQKARKSYILAGIILIIISVFFIWSFSPTSYEFSVTVLPLTEYYVEIDSDIITQGDIIHGSITTAEPLKFYVKDLRDVIYNAGQIMGTHEFKFTATRDGAIYIFLENLSPTKTASANLQLTVTSPELWPAGGIILSVIAVIGIVLIIFGIRKREIPAVNP